MSIDAYYEALKDRAGLTWIADAQDGNVLMTDANHTHFEVPDPKELPDGIRNLVLASVLDNLALHALGY